MVKYEYGVVADDCSPDELEAILDELGEKGFKLVAVDGGAIFMMREVADE